MLVQAATSVLPERASEPEMASLCVSTSAWLATAGGPVVPVAWKLRPRVASSLNVSTDSPGRPSAPAGAYRAEPDTVVPELLSSPTSAPGPKLAPPSPEGYTNFVA